MGEIPDSEIGRLIDPDLAAPETTAVVPSIGAILDAETGVRHVVPEIPGLEHDLPPMAAGSPAEAAGTVSVSADLTVATPDFSHTTLLAREPLAGNGSTSTESTATPESAEAEPVKLLTIEQLLHPRTILETKKAIDTAVKHAESSAGLSDRELLKANATNMAVENLLKRVPEAERTHQLRVVIDTLLHSSTGFITATENVAKLQARQEAGYVRGRTWHQANQMLRVNTRNEIERFHGEYSDEVAGSRVNKAYDLMYASALAESRQGTVRKTIRRYGQLTLPKKFAIGAAVTAVTAVAGAAVGGTLAVVGIAAGGRLLKAGVSRSAQNVRRAESATLNSNADTTNKQSWIGRKVGAIARARPFAFAGNKLSNFQQNRRIGMAKRFGLDESWMGFDFEGTDIASELISGRITVDGDKSFVDSLIISMNSKRQKEFIEARYGVLEGAVIALGSVAVGSIGKAVSAHSHLVGHSNNAGNGARGATPTTHNGSGGAVGETTTTTAPQPTTTAPRPTTTTPQPTTTAPRPTTSAPVTDTTVDTRPAGNGAGGPRYGSTSGPTDTTGHADTASGSASGGSNGDTLASPADTSFRHAGVSDYKWESWSAEQQGQWMSLITRTDASGHEHLVSEAKQRALADYFGQVEENRQHVLHHDLHVTDGSIVEHAQSPGDFDVVITDEATLAGQNTPDYVARLAWANATGYEPSMQVRTALVDYMGQSYQDIVGQPLPEVFQTNINIPFSRELIKTLWDEEEERRLAALTAVGSN